MALRQLAQDWQVWVRENVARGCSRESMLALLVQGGHARAMAEQAIADAHGSLLTRFVPPAAAPWPRQRPKV